MRPKRPVTDIYPYRNGRPPKQPIYVKPMRHLRALYFAANGRDAKGQQIPLTYEQRCILANVERAPRPWVERAIAAAQRGY